MSRPLPFLPYFQGVYAELRKVVWPSVPQVTRYFFAVVLSVALATAFIGSIDYLLVKYALPVFIRGM
jgi:preprotein translocase subunit SecE